MTKQTKLPEWKQSYIKDSTHVLLNMGNNHIVMLGTLDEIHDYINKRIKFRRCLVIAKILDVHFEDTL